MKEGQSQNGGGGDKVGWGIAFKNTFPAGHPLDGMAVRRHFEDTRFTWPCFWTQEWSRMWRLEPGGALAGGDAESQSCMFGYVVAGEAIEIAREMGSHQVALSNIRAGILGFYGKRWGQQFVPEGKVGGLRFLEARWKDWGERKVVPLRAEPHLVTSGKGGRAVLKFSNDRGWEAIVMVGGDNGNAGMAIVQYREGVLCDSPRGKAAIREYQMVSLGGRQMTVLPSAELHYANGCLWDPSEGEAAACWAVPSAGEFVVSHWRNGRLAGGAERAAVTIFSNREVAKGGLPRPTYMEYVDKTGKRGAWAEVLSQDRRIRDIGEEDGKIV